MLALWIVTYVFILGKLRSIAAAAVIVNNTKCREGIMK